MLWVMFMCDVPVPLGAKNKKWSPLRKEGRKERDDSREEGRKIELIKWINSEQMDGIQTDRKTSMLKQQQHIFRGDWSINQQTSKQQMHAPFLCFLFICVFVHYLFSTFFC